MQSVSVWGGASAIGDKQVNMRHGSPLVIVVVLTVLLAGCGPALTPPVQSAGSDVKANGDATTYPLVVTDDLGAEIRLPSEPQRLVSLAPSLTEITFALGLADRVVGVTSYCTYPPEARRKPQVGGYVNPSDEKVLALKPDLVLCTRGTPTTFISGLRAAGLVVAAFHETSFDDVVRAIETIGVLCNVQPKARQVAGGLRQELANLERQTGHLTTEQRPRTLFAVWLEPLFVAGPGSFQDAILQAAGARNVAGTDKPYANLSVEAAIAADPQVLLLSSQHAVAGTAEAGKTLARLRQDPAWRGVSAVKQGRVVVLDAGHVAVPGPRLILGMRDIARAVQPDLFAVVGAQ